MRRPVYFFVDRFPTGIAIPGGAFADSTLPAPKISFYEARKHAWTGIPVDAEHVD